MRRWIFFIYGLFSYLLFLAVYAYMAGFVGNLIVPKSIDSPHDGSIAIAVVINLMLLALFGIQHSVMARPAFKRVWTRIIPEPIERSTYVLASNAVVILLMWQWRSIDYVIWDFQHPLLRGVAWVGFATGWLLVPLASMMISHFDLFGARQVWFHLRGQRYQDSPFRTPYMYKHIRHPLYVGWMIAFWATPTMTVGHLLFAAVLTGYMVLAAAAFEEPDLIVHFGDQYENYRRRVPAYIPRWSTKLAAPVPTSPATESNSSPA
jgi:methanethiol S-methyltransferase